MLGLAYPKTVLAKKSKIIPALVIILLCVGYVYYFSANWVVSRSEIDESRDVGKVFIHNLIESIQHNPKHIEFIFEYAKKIELNLPERTSYIEISNVPLWAKQYPIEDKFNNILDNISQIKSGNIELSFQFIDGRWLNYSSHLKGFSYPTMMSLFLIIILLSFLFLIYFSLSSVFMGAFRHVNSTTQKLKGDIRTQLKYNFGFPLFSEVFNTIKQLQKHVVNLITEKSQMVSTISHDLRIPLTRMRMGWSLDREQYVPTDDLNEIDQMIASLVEYAKFDPARERKQNFRMDLLVQTCCYEFEDMGYDVVVDKIQSGITIFGAQLSLKRCINNILNNAFKFGTQVQVSLSEKGKQIILKIRDNGLGIAEEELQNVLKPFYKTSAGQKSGKSGSGLGLNIVQDIVHYHQGKVALENASEGGVIVTLFFPKDIKKASKQSKF